MSIKSSQTKKNCGLITDLLPWAVFIEQGIVLNKDGSIQQTIRFRGRDYTSSSKQELAIVCSKLNNACRRFGSEWIIFVEACRYKTESYFKQNNFPDTVSKLVDEERRLFFEDSQQTYNSDYYFTLQYYPAESTKQTTKNFFIEEEQASNENIYNKILAQFKNQTRLFLGLLNEVMQDAAFLNCDETLTYLHQTISDKKHKISTPSKPDYFDRFLADTTIENGLNLKLGENTVKTISIIGYPSSSFPSILERLNTLSVEYRWVSRYIPIDKLEAESFLKGYRRKWFSKRKTALSLLFEIFSKNESNLQDNSAITLSKDSDEAIQELMADYVSYGFLTVTITLFNKSFLQLESSVNEVERIINSMGFTTIKENFNALESWLSSIPGNITANIRKPLLHSLNFCHLLPLCASWNGSMINKHLKDSALMLTQTSGSSPFYLNNHIKDVGHQIIIGPTGSGKSLLLNIMALQFLRYENAQVFIFDKGLSFLVSTLSVGGKMYSMGSDGSESLSFQPLVEIDKEEERIWCHNWLLLYCLSGEATSDESQELWNALVLLADLTPEHRNLSNLCPLIQHEKLRQRLKIYSEGNFYGKLLDSFYQPLSKNNWIYFEMEKIMEYSKALPAVLMYLFHLLEKRFNGHPTFMILDEAWIFLDNKLFSNHLRQWLKTLRKKNVSVIFATQSIDDLTSSHISSALIESCPSSIFLPNKKAEDPQIASFYHEVGMNNQQIKLIASLRPQNDYYYQSTEGNALFNLCLGPIALAFADSKNISRKKNIIELYHKYGYPNFIPIYLNSLGMNEISDLFNIN